jgi:hypothetical protein
MTRASALGLGFRRVEREISDPLTQSRLAAQKVREIAT